MICPAPRGTLYGNRITATRWARILRKLGHSVAIQTAYGDEACDLLIALHAKRSAQAVFEFHKRYPDKPVVVALTGTDLYRDIRHSQSAQRGLEIATRLVALQPLATAELAAPLRSKLRTIYQSVEKTAPVPRRPRDVFQICVIGHLRSVKDPFRAAFAARSLPPESKMQIVHAGAAMDERMAALARAEQRRNPRYGWLDEIPRWKTRRLIASSHLLVLSSRIEGGANVISEAIVEGTPVIASRIPGSIGLLGEEYPGFYPFGDTQALRRLLLQAETDSRFYRQLVSHCGKLAALFQPSREMASWRNLLNELTNLALSTRL